MSAAERAIEPDAIELAESEAQAQAEAATLELAVYEATPGTAIRTNIDAIVSRVEALLADHGAWEIADSEGARAAKAARAEVRKVRKRIDDERLRLKDLYEAPLRAFEAEVKRATGPLDEADRAYKAALDEWERRRRAELMDHLREHYDDMAGELAELVPFERFVELKAPKAARGNALRWTQASVGFVKACDEMDAILRKLHDEWVSIDELKCEDEAERDRLRAYWCESLDFGEACSRIARERRQAAAIREQREAREAWEREQMTLAQARPEPKSEPQPEPETTPAPQPQPEPEPQARTQAEQPAPMWEVRVRATAAEVRRLAATLRDMGLHGTVRKIKEDRQ